MSLLAAVVLLLLQLPGVEPIFVEVRVVDGQKSADNRSISGRVEVLYNNTWGTICDYYWDQRDATVVCKQLGYSEAIRPSRGAEYGRGTGTIWLEKVECDGDEENLGQCRHEGWGIHLRSRSVHIGWGVFSSVCDHSNDAGVVCSAEPILVDVRVVDSQKSADNWSLSGRVEVLYNNTWGTICADLSWNQEEVTVICKQLGYSEAIRSSLGAEYGRGTGPIWLSDVDCAGDEENLAQCRHGGWGVHYGCGHSDDVGVVCSAEPILVDVRVVDGQKSADNCSISGRVEVLYNNTWGTICGIVWHQGDATVVCKQLGYSEAIRPSRGAYGQGTGPVWLGYVSCAGDEENLTQCRHAGWGDDLSSWCDHSLDAGVVCSEIVAPPVFLNKTTVTDVVVINGSTIPAPELPMGTDVVISEVGKLTSLTFYCSLLNSGIPSANISWTVNGRSLISSRWFRSSLNVINSTDNTTSRLLVNVSNFKSSFLCCKAENIAGKDLLCSELKLLSAKSPKLSFQTFGSNALLVKDALVNNGTKSLLLPVVLGRWSCVCENKEGSINSSIHVGPCCEDVTFKIGAVHPVLAGFSFTIVCRVLQARPDPSVKWFRNGELLSNNTNQTTLRVHVNRSEPAAAAGDYRCTAENEVANDTAHSNMALGKEILILPRLLRSTKHYENMPENITVFFGDSSVVQRGKSVTIHCSVVDAGIPAQSELSWMDVKTLTVSKGVSWSNDGYLTIETALVNATDLRYCCTARNEAGSDTACSNITIEGVAVVMEFVPFGDLRSNLMKWKVESHLASLNVIHRDLACRNVLVGENKTLKVSDFGLSKEIDGMYTSTSKTKLPIRWMSPEAIRHRIFSQKSDVWSFGVCLWEICTLGEVPYSHLSSAEVAEAVDRSAYLRRPSSCHDDVYSLMLNCWKRAAAERPAFEDIEKYLADLITKNCHQNYISLESGFLPELEAEGVETEMKRSSSLPAVEPATVTSRVSLMVHHAAL
uniref:Deleted in malignant brain tumors 1 protein-like protein 2 n=1 Tax=Halisarca dujardinii TaxID=2583056 RepID=A0AA96MN67_HALDU|nr:deleted in malignant brain tumors 1 protein-like protein 2 [Halisarca dujardinii]